MDDQTKNIVACPSIENGSSSAPSLVVEDYAEDIAALKIPEEKAREFLETIWNIMVMCADVELGFDPVSLICGQNGNAGVSSTFADSCVVKSKEEKSSKTYARKEAR